MAGCLASDRLEKSVRYPEIPTRRPIVSIVPFSDRGMAPEQAGVVRLLVDPQTYGGRKPAHFDTAVSHLFVDEDCVYILRKPGNFSGVKCLTPEDRWQWCEAQCMKGFARLGAIEARPLPIARRNGVLCLGGPGSIQDWVLKITCGKIIVETGFITLRHAA